MRRPIVVSWGLAAACLAAGWSLGVAADVFRWVDKDGVVHYSDKPPAPDAKPAELPQLQTFKSGTLPQLPDGAPATAAPAQPAAPATVTIVAPAQQETIRDAERHVSVSVNAPVTGGNGLVYYLDGAAQNDSPTQSTAFLLSGVERGEHTIAVALVGPDGHEIARSASTTIYMKPPTVGMTKKH
ncbi:MAG: DUF4124 domain-containing protein [Nevskia sp.]|nr:DUF4124 domain-containing protein [Nevskia sp.]